MNFPYCKCNTSPSSSPWRVGAPSFSWDAAGTKVTLPIFTDPNIYCSVPFNKLELDTHSLSASLWNKGTIKVAFLGTKKVTTIWEVSRPVVKFTAMSIPCSDGANGVDFSFVLPDSVPLSTLCGGSFCRYAAFDTTGITGNCPIGYFPSSQPIPTK